MPGTSLPQNAFGVASTELTEEERGALIAAGKDPQDHAALMLPAGSVQAHGFTDPTTGSTFIAFVLQASVPQALLEFPLGGVLGSNGQSAPSQKAQNALPVAPIVRFIVARPYLAPALREAMAKQPGTMLLAEQIVAPAESK